MNFLSKMPNKVMTSLIGTNLKLPDDMTSIYDVEIYTLQGEVLDLSRFKGKYMMFVNVASKCGFTGQYSDLQELYNRYGSKLEIIGVPCNQFGKQEPGDAEEISSFCDRNYGVSFTMTEKIKVKGPEQHALYRWLTRKENNGKSSNAVKWNFQKYLVDPEGELVDVFYSITKPTSSKIRKLLK